MSAGTYLGLCLSLLVVCVSLGSAEQWIFRHTGMSVTLTFQVPTGNVSVWLKRLHNEKYIFYCRDGNPERPSDQEESFKGRVEGMDCNRINGTVSVTLRNLTRNDNGTYEFHGVDRDERRFNKTVFLIVTDPGQTGGDTEDRGEEAGASRGRTLLTISLSGAENGEMLDVWKRATACVFHFMATSTARRRPELCTHHCACVCVRVSLHTSPVFSHEPLHQMVQVRQL